MFEVTENNFFGRGENLSHPQGLLFNRLGYDFLTFSVTLKVTNVAFSYAQLTSVNKSQAFFGLIKRVVSLSGGIVKWWVLLSDVNVSVATTAWSMFVRLCHVCYVQYAYNRNTRRNFARSPAARARNPPRRRIKAEESL